MKFIRSKWFLIPLLFTGVLILLFSLNRLHDSNEENEEAMEQEERERESGADKQMEMLWQARAYPEHTDLNARYLSAWQHAQAMKNPEILSGANGTAGSNGVDYGSWTSVGSLNIGRVLSIAIDPVTPSTIFIGSASGGIYKSTNSGSSWTFVRTRFPVLGVPTIAFQPGNSNVILAGTGEVYRTDNSNIGYNVWKARGTYGVGILRSSDGGVTWSQVLSKNYSNLFGINMIRFDPNNANNVFACTTNGLFKSTDGGVTWGASPILNKIYVTDVVINSANSNIMMAAIGNLVNTDKGVYRTTDGGANWTKVVSAAIPTTFSGFSRFAYLSGSTVYLSMGRDDAGENELFRSTDFGVNWTVLTGSHHCQYQFWFANAVAIVPSRPDTLYMAGVSFYRYRASTQARTSHGSMHSDFHDIEFDPSNNNIAYIACDGGMYKTTNALAASPTFSQINSGLNIAQFYASLGVSGQTADRFVGGLQDNGIWAYNGTTWSQRFGGDGGPTVVDPTNEANVYASNDARKVSKSTTGISGAYSQVLASWAFVGDDRTGFMAPMAISKSSPSTLYVASDNLHKTTNSGTSWTNNSGTISANTAYIEAQFKTGIAIGVSPTNANKLYVSLSPFSQRVDNALNVVGNPSVMKSINGGTSFTNITTGLPNRFVLDFAINPSNDDDVMVVLGGYGSSHVYKTTDGGLTWVDRGTGLPDVPFNAIAIDPANSNYVYAGCDLGVYVSNNGGVTWYDFNGGFLDGTMVFDLQFTFDNKIVAATHGKGIYISNLASYSTLPSGTISFSGSNKKLYNELNWICSDEKNVASYELERSMDGNLYSKITQVTPKNQTRASYSYNDQIPGAVSQAVFYYRLKKTDKDGSVTYSNIVAIKYFKSATLEVLGNPINNNSSLKIAVNAPQQVTINLFDFKGSLVMTKKASLTTGINFVSLENLPVLPSGTYVVEAVTQNEKLRKKVSH